MEGGAPTPGAAGERSNAPAARQSQQQEPPETPEGLSQFFRRVLDQLSLSSWLPAVMLVGCCTIMLQLISKRNVDIPAAAAVIVEKPIAALVLVIPSIVLAAIVIQAFSFEVIRLLEGYWGLTRIGSLLAIVKIYGQVRRVNRLDKRHTKLERRAFREARENMLEAEINRPVIDLLEDNVYGREVEHAAEIVNEARELGGWRPFCSPYRLAALDRTLARKTEYPELHRLLPTRLGNVLRSSEDALVLPDGDLEGLIMRRYDSIPQRLRTHHNQFRTRLDMYCTLFFVFLTISGLGLWLVVRVDESSRVVALTFPLVFVVLSAVSYVAAVSSARGYGVAIRAIQRETVN